MTDFYKLIPDRNVSLTTVPAPINFRLDGTITEVIEDTLVPANNAPLPVKITSTTGDINITAGDLNVHTSHLAPNYDSSRIGDGTNLMGVNADGSIDVRGSAGSVIDQIDTTPLLDVSSTNITASSGSPVEIVSSLAADTHKIQVIEDIGEFIGIYVGAAGVEVLLAVLPLGGGEVDVNISATTRISLRAMKNTAITSDYIAINFIG